MRIITLTTDFGARDWFAGTLHGVILRINPRAHIVNLTHEIPAGDIRAGAFALAAACRCFPKGTLHVAVVDPGVGGERPAIAIRTERYSFVGPDNGVLSWALAREKIRAVVRLENDRYFLRPVSATFHGRDVFAPVAAHLSRGVVLDKLGPRQKDFLLLPWPEARAKGNRIEGEVIYVDHFGNAITNIANANLAARTSYEVFAGRKRLCPVESFYQSAPPGRAVAVRGSSGFLEISVNGGSAARELKLVRGSRLTIRRR